MDSEPEQEHHHVHFNTNDVENHSNDMTVKKGANAGSVDVHVGFLQVFHKYEVTVSIPVSYLPKSSKYLPHIPEMPQSFGRITEVSDYKTGEKVHGDDNFVDVVLELIPQKEKLHKEKFYIVSSEEKSTCCQLTLNCRVLGKGKGTPLLKNGVRMIEVLDDPDESDINSDWQGF